MSGQLALAVALLAYAAGVLHGGWASREERARLRKERDRYRRWLAEERTARDRLWERYEDLQQELGR